MSDRAVPAGVEGGGMFCSVTASVEGCAGGTGGLWGSVMAVMAMLVPRQWVVEPQWV